MLVEACWQQCMAVRVCRSLAVCGALFACSVGCVLLGGLDSAGGVSVRVRCGGITVQWEQQRGGVLLEGGALVWDGVAIGA